MGHDNANASNDARREPRLYNNGNTFDNNAVMAKLTILSVASIGVQVRRLSNSVRRPIFVKIQKPESFIQLPISEPALIARERSEFPRWRVGLV